VANFSSGRQAIDAGVTASAQGDAAVAKSRSFAAIISAVGGNPDIEMG
jgi:hypothetical protein